MYVECTVLSIPEYKVGNHEGNSRPKVPTVPCLAYFRIRFLAVRIVVDGGQRPVPARARRHLEQQDERLEEGLEVVDIVEAAPDLDVLEEGHAEDGKDEHDEEEEEADVEEGGHGHDEGEEEGADALGALDETQDSPHLGHAHHAQQGRRHEILLDKVTANGQLWI